MPHGEPLNREDRRQLLLQARAEIDRELAEIDRETTLAPLRMAQDGHGALDGATVTLKFAARAWAISYEGARKRAMRLEPLGLAVKHRPGGWRVSVSALN